MSRLDDLQAQLNKALKECELLREENLLLGLSPAGQLNKNIQTIDFEPSKTSGETVQITFDDLLKALDAGRSPLLLTERTAHVEYFASRLKGFAKKHHRFARRSGKKATQGDYRQIAQYS